MDLNSTQLVILCYVFVGLHLIAVPGFVWALRGKQFSGREQNEWHLNDADTPSVVPLSSPVSSRRARWMLGVLGAMAVMMLASVFLVMFVALHATAHPATGKCPF